MSVPSDDDDMESCVELGVATWMEWFVGASEDELLDSKDAFNTDDPADNLLR